MVTASVFSFSLISLFRPGTRAAADGWGGEAQLLALRVLQTSKVSILNER